MRVDCALLCDSVTVRDGLLHILGGGITRCLRPTYPAPLGMALALRLLVHQTEADAEHRLTLMLADQDGAKAAELEIGFTPQKPVGIQQGEQISLAIPIPMQQWLLPHAGPYSFDLLIDGIHQTSIPFLVVTEGQPGQPPPQPKSPRARKS